MSFNDESKINSILKDRMHIVRMKGFQPSDKVKIARQYLIPSISEELQFDENNAIISDDMLKHIITQYTDEEGVRSFRRALKTIYSKLNVLNLVQQSSKTELNDIVTFSLDTSEFPITISPDRIKVLLKGKSSTSTSVQMMYL